MGKKIAIFAENFQKNETYHPNDNNCRWIPHRHFMQQQDRGTQENRGHQYKD